jgi:hypothetical protein
MTTGTTTQELQLAAPRIALDPDSPEVSTVRSWLEAEARASGINLRPIPPWELPEFIGGQAWDLGRNLLAECPVEWNARVAQLPTAPHAVVVEIVATEANVHLSDTFLDPLFRIAEGQGLSPVISRNRRVGTHTLKDAERLFEGADQRSLDTTPSTWRPGWSLDTEWGLRVAVEVNALTPGLLAALVGRLAAGCDASSRCGHRPTADNHPLGCRVTRQDRGQPP